MKHKICKTLLAAAVLAAVPAFAQQKMQAPAVTVAPAVEADETGTKKYVGKLDAILDVSLPARVSGKIMKYHFNDGEFVKKGTLLIELEDTTYVAAHNAAQAQLQQAEAQIRQATAQISQTEAQILQATAQIGQAQASLTYSTQNLEREKSLKSVNSRKEFDAAKRDYDAAVSSKAAAEASLASAKASKAAAEGSLASAKASKSAAEAALLDAKNNLSYTKIYAEFDGKIGKATYSAGNYVTPSSGALATLKQFDPIYVKFSISEPDFMNNFGTPEALQKNGVVRIRLSDRSLYEQTAELAIVDNHIDTRTGTIMLWAKIDNKDHRLTPGAVVDVLLSKKVPQKRPAVPISAVQISKNNQFVWVLDPATNMVRQQPVVPGELVGGNQIVTGVKPGDLVVTEGTHKIIMLPGVPPVVNPVRK